MTEAAAPDRTDPAPPWRTAATVALALAVYALGTRIPMPGLDMEALNAQLGYRGPGAMERFSIFALWVIPFLVVLVYAEIAKLAVRPLARWQAASARNARRMDLVIHLAALAIAGSQGYGLATALEATGMADGFVPLAVACLVGSTALLIWLSGRLALPGLGGFWLLLAVLPIVDLPRELAQWFGYMRSGFMPASLLLVLGACLAGAAAMVVFANSALSRQFGEGGPARAVATAALLWPPFLAAVVSGDAMILLAPDGVLGDPELFTIVQLIAMMLLIPLFVWAYSRLLPRGAGTRPVLFVVAGVQMAVCAGAALLPMVMNAPLYFDAARFIVLMTVMFAASRSFIGRSEPARPSHPGQ